MEMVDWMIDDSMSTTSYCTYRGGLFVLDIAFLLLWFSSHVNL